MHKEVKNSKNVSFPVVLKNIDEKMEKWLKEAQKRIFSIAAGDRVSFIASAIVQVGFGKILYAANELGVDIEKSKPYIFFAPDGTCSYNEIRIKRGFTYGCIFKADFEGLIGTNNSMPNGCGYSLYELKDWNDDETLIRTLNKIKQNITEEQAKELGKGNHFIAVYKVLDAISGEDTERRMVLLHCSGHDLSKKPLYFFDWLEETDGCHKVKTPHGDIYLLESEAKKRYIKEFEKLDKYNKEARVNVMKELFKNSSYELVSSITHQGLYNNGSYHFLGIQKSEKLIPIAFNAEEGGIVVKTKRNLSKQFIDQWEQGTRVKELGYEKEFRELNFTPHGGGYEFKYPIKKFVMFLNEQGLDHFSVELKKPKEPSIKLIASYFKPIREYMTYRRKLPVMKEVFKAELTEHIYDLNPFMQLHPKVSIPGGHY